MAETGRAASSKRAPATTTALGEEPPKRQKMDEKAPAPTGTVVVMRYARTYMFTASVRTGEVEETTIGHADVQPVVHDLWAKYGDKVRRDHTRQYVYQMVCTTATSSREDEQAWVHIIEGRCVCTPCQTSERTAMNAFGALDGEPFVGDWMENADDYERVHEIDLDEYKACQACTDQGPGKAYDGVMRCMVGHVWAGCSRCAMVFGFRKPQQGQRAFLRKCPICRAAVSSVSPPPSQSLPAHAAAAMGAAADI